MIFEELLHLLPSLQKLYLAYVGLDIPKNAERKVGDTMSMECCPVCTSSGRIRALGLWNGAYHDYVKEVGYEAPDLAVAFHTGASQDEQPSWLPSLQ